MRIVEQFGLAVGADLVNLAVGIGGRVHLVLRVEHNRVDFETIQLRKGTALSSAVDDEDPGCSAAGAAARGVKVALGVGRQRPEIGRGGIEDLGEFWSQKDAAVGAQGEILERSAFKIGPVAMLPEVGVHCKTSSQGGQRHQKESNCFHWMVLLYCDPERVAAVDQHVEGNTALFDRAL